MEEVHTPDAGELINEEEVMARRYFYVRRGKRWHIYTAVVYGRMRLLGSCRHEANVVAYFPRAERIG